MSAQSMIALQRANAVRVGIAAIRRELGAGAITVEEALADERAQSMTVFDVLRAQHRWGRTRTLGALRSVHVSENRRVRDLTDRQHDVIAAVVSGALTDDELWAAA